MKDMISAKHITKKIILPPDIPLDLLVDANFYAGEGEFLVLTGVSGTGKSTLLKILLGYEKAPGSEIIINNKNINEMKEFELEDFRNKNLGICIPKLTSIPKNLTVKQSIFERMKNFYEESTEEEVDKILSDFKLSPNANFKVSSISEMEQYKLMLALAFCSKPPVIIVDEVLDYFEKEERDNLLDVILKIQNNYRITIVIVTVKVDIIKRSSRAINIMNNTTYWVDLNHFREITADK